MWCNHGGFGIDGNMSSLVGASLMHPERLFFGAVGDLSFFYDINILGNRHIGNNVRILLINNGLGAEFHLFKQLNLTYVNGIEKYLSAGGHFGRKSPDVVKHLATDLGFEYISATFSMNLSLLSIIPSISHSAIRKKMPKITCLSAIFDIIDFDLNYLHSLTAIHRPNSSAICYIIIKITLPLPSLTIF